MPLAEWQVSGSFTWTFIQVSRFGFVLVEEELRGFLCMLLVMVKISNNELLCSECPDTVLLPDSSSNSHRCSSLQWRTLNLLRVTQLLLEAGSFLDSWLNCKNLKNKVHLWVSFITCYLHLADNVVVKLALGRLSLKQVCCGERIWRKPVLLE